MKSFEKFDTWLQSFFGPAWKDPVWSKVISGVLLAILTLVSTFLVYVGKSMYEAIPFATIISNIGKFISRPVSISTGTLLFMIIGIIVFTIMIVAYIKRNKIILEEAKSIFAETQSTMENAKSFVEHSKSKLQEFDNKVLFDKMKESFKEQFIQSLDSKIQPINNLSIEEFFDGVWRSEFTYPNRQRGVVSVIKVVGEKMFEDHIHKFNISDIRFDKETNTLTFKKSFVSGNEPPLINILKINEARNQYSGTENKNIRITYYKYSNYGELEHGPNT